MIFLYQFTLHGFGSVVGVYSALRNIIVISFVFAAHRLANCARKSPTAGK
jgi:hypothetical protein